MAKKLKVEQITPAEIEKYAQQLRNYSNSAKYEIAYNLASRLMKKYPHVLHFAYVEAVMTAEDTTGLSEKEANKRYKLATEKFKRLLRKLRGVDTDLRYSMRNEYYWFSKQPYKQYLLGKSEKNKVPRGSYYSQGVGSAMLAKKYGEAGKISLMQKWALRSEKAWTKFFKEDPNWFNSYFFAAMAFGYQNRFKEMDKAFEMACKISGKPKNWKAVRDYRKEIVGLVNSIPPSKLPPRR